VAWKIHAFPLEFKSGMEFTVPSVKVPQPLDDTETTIGKFQSFIIVGYFDLLSVAKKKSVSTRTRSKLSAAVMEMLRYFHQQVLVTTSLKGLPESFSFIAF